MTTKQTMALAMVLLAAPAAAQEAGSLARETAKEYRELARYPESSQVLKKGDADPIRAKRQATRQTRRGPDASDPSLSVWAAKVSFEKGQPVDLFATLEERGKAFRSVDSIGAEIVDATGSILSQIVYRDDGQGVDRRAGDGIYSARLSPEGLFLAGSTAEPAASYLVRVKARLANGDLREAAGGFLYSNPAAHLTGQYRDFLREGDLVIAAEVEVAEQGRFHLAGTLYARNGEPVGTAQAAANLEPGRHWIELSFYGLMFHDRKAAGPYRLGTLALATTRQMPNALNDLAENVWLTRAYRVGQMRSTSFERPQLIEAAQRLEREAERAERERQQAREQ